MEVLAAATENCSRMRFFSMEKGVNEGKEGSSAGVTASLEDCEYMYNENIVQY